MKNKHVGFLIMGISVIIAIIVMIFNLGLKKIVGLSCTHGASCSMYDTIAIQTYISLAIAGLIFLIGLFLVFIKEEEKVITKIKKIREKVEVKRKPINYSKLNKDEKVLVKIIEAEEGSIFQADLVEKSEFNKVKVTRLLDKLEGRQIIERKRRGMTNIVVLK